ncbi:MAG: S8 family serine peptidase [Hyphomicrobiaceae bacterium]
MRYIEFIVFSLVLLTGSIDRGWADKTRTPAAWLTLAIDRICNAGSVDGLIAQSLLPGTWLLQEKTTSMGRSGKRTDVRLALPGGDELRIVRQAFADRLRRFTVEYFKQSGAQLMPNMQAASDATCHIRAGRRIVSPRSSATRSLEQLDGDLQTVRWTETLQAPWPSGADPGGPRVALVDSGLAYDLDIYRNRLARGADGVPLGFDFWDMDPLPYDGDVSRSPFLPIRHGSAVASILVREAPMAALIPMRYPRPDMGRMADVVLRAVNSGARIIAMPLGSNRPIDWTAFEKAMRAHANVLAIVSAGNNGRDLDQMPLWPAVLTLDNMIVVTSADAFGRLAAGSNWGRTSVDIMVPAENVPVVDFRGASGKASGSSYAVPRLAALAARIVSRQPGISVKALKERIYARATPSPYEKDVVAVGWIPDPLRD